MSECGHSSEIVLMSFGDDQSGWRRLDDQHQVVFIGMAQTLQNAV